MVMTVWRQDLLLHLPKIGEVTAPICDNFIKQVRIMERPLPATESGETRHTGTETSLNSQMMMM